jgi:hypothetical protein
MHNNSSCAMLPVWGIMCNLCTFRVPGCTSAAGCMTTQLSKLVMLTVNLMPNSFKAHTKRSQVVCAAEAACC